MPSVVVVAVENPPDSRGTPALLLTPWTIVAAASRNHYSFDRSLAHQARFAFAPVDAMLQLKESFFAISVNIVGYGRSAQRDGFPQHVLDRRVESP